MRSGVPELLRARRPPRRPCRDRRCCPGFRRTQCAPASSALSASVWLKWMSAIIGIGDSRDDRLQRLGVLLARNGAADDVGAGLGDAVDLLHRRCRSAVSVFVIVWTATGAPPPIGTPPTWIWRSEGIVQCRAARCTARMPDRRRVETPTTVPGSFNMPSRERCLLPRVALAGALAAPAASASTTQQFVIQDDHARESTWSRR